MKVEIFACPLWWWCGWLRSCDDLVFRSPALNPGAWLGIAGGGLEQTAAATWDTHHQSPHTCHAGILYTGMGHYHHWRLSMQSKFST